MQFLEFLFIFQKVDFARMKAIILHLNTGSRFLEKLTVFYVKLKALSQSQKMLKIQVFVGLKLSFAVVFSF